MIITIIILSFFALAFILTYCIYKYVFGSKRALAREKLPRGRRYEEYHSGIDKNIKRIDKIKFETVKIKSFDGLELSAKYCPGEIGAPVVIFFHGYRSNAMRDGSGGFWYCRERGMGIILVDQRAHGDSEGSAISFGINERRDCLSWIDYVRTHIRSDSKIILMGLSMGASTVMMAMELIECDNVIGVVADCGFSSPRDIIKSVIKRKNLPSGPLYGLSAFSAKVFGRFDINSASAVESVSRSNIPILIIHGASDTFVPCDMAYMLHSSAKNPAGLLIVEEAEHGVSFYRDTEAYIDALNAFVCKITSDSIGE